jgi:hypothetical protein
MKLVVLPAVTVLPEAIVPLAPAEVVMLKTLATKLAVTAQSAVTAPVVYVLPSMEPSQPVTESIAKLLSGVTVKTPVLPEAISLLVGVIAPLSPAVALTVKVVGAAATKLAVTAQSAVTAPVVYVLPSRLPAPQPLTESITKSLLGVTVKAPVLPEAISLLVGLIVPLAPAVALTVKVVGAATKVAITEQFAVTAPVVYVLPLREPAQPLTEPIAKSLLGVTVKTPVLPETITLLGGLIVPLSPAVALTVKVVAEAEMKVAITEQFAVTAPVVYVLPSREPAQPLTEPITKLLLGVTVKAPVLPEAITLLGGLIVPLSPAVALTVKVVAEAEMKVAVTVQSAVTAPVVYVLPSRVPEQPLTEPITKFVFGVTVKKPLLPEAILLLVAMVIVPLSPAVELTVKVVGAAAGVPLPPPLQAAISGVITNKEINNFKREEMLICFFILNPFSFYNFITL